ncbi:hypothetical protein [Rhodomicrobium udaipurense]|uniref:Uncharacterized protein n=1 Tax=Rhodomicrobium udaipurense TaxID=1202716 RepID=A0A8I1KIR8_9HYPH|nr:hypothetical protein [Rhodomicrobium udaipurense]MBJ7542937.1 hypothetical protein [Rhodomicrobium udaipurense]
MTRVYMRKAAKKKVAASGAAKLRLDREELDNAWEAEWWTRQGLNL